MSISYQFSQSANLKIRVATSVLQFLGILLSVFRLWFRYRIRRLWWEDAWALIACLGAIVLLISEWMYLEGAWVVSLVGFWLYSFVWTLVIWAVRMSILFSIARIVHPTKYMRRIVTAFAVFFSLVFLTLTALHLWWYTRDLTWLKRTAFYTLPATWLPYPVLVCELATDCVSDVILICCPVRLLWSMKLPTNQRRMIIAIFSSSIIMTIVSVFRAVSQICNLLSLVGVATDVEVTCSIICCNLLVVVTLVYRIARSVSRSNGTQVVSGPEDDDYTIPFTARITPALTTVHLSDPYTSEESSKEPTRDADGSLPRMER